MLEWRPPAILPDVLSPDPKEEPSRATMMHSLSEDGDSESLTNERRILLLGPSSLAYTDTDDSDAIPALLQAELRQRLPGFEWRCEVRSWLYTPRSPEIAQRHVDAFRPDVVVLSLVTTPFWTNNPIAVIRRRWPRLYPYARRIAERLKRMARGGHIASPRGWLFRFPRLLLVWAIGAEPEVDYQEATDATTATLDALARNEDLQVICGFSRFLPGKRTPPVSLQRIAFFTERVLGRCRSHHFAAYDRAEALATAGKAEGHARDLDYADLQTRRFEAGLMADLIAETFEA